MAGEAESQIPEGLVEAIRKLIPALYAMAESNCRIAEALIAAGEDQPADDAGEDVERYMDGSPVR